MESTVQEARGACSQKPSKQNPHLFDQTEQQERGRRSRETGADRPQSGGGGSGGGGVGRDMVHTGAS